MSDEEILNKRWQKTDKVLKQYLKRFDSLEEDIVDEIVFTINSLDISYNDLNKPISKADSKRLDKKIKEAKEKGLYNDYLTYLMANKITYSIYIEILIFLIYLEHNESIKKYSEEIFTLVSEDIYQQALEEIPPRFKKKPFSLTWEFIWSLLWVPSINKHYYDYLNLLAMTNEQEIFKQLLIYLQQNKKITNELIETLIAKQMNRIISINDGKYSGTLDDVCRTLGNEVYVKPFDSKTLKVRFIAELDKKTTQMCKGMNGMTFFVNDWNRFYRYSAVDKKDVYYVVYGLERGINLPPIMNHFHWCRSTITYQL